MKSEKAKVKSKKEKLKMEDFTVEEELEIALQKLEDSEIANSRLKLEILTLKDSVDFHKKALETVKKQVSELVKVMGIG